MMTCAQAGHGLALYLPVINLIAFLAFALDKHRAVHHQWRLSERSLLMLALLGGGFGAVAGMECFRHKTQHPRFAIGLPLILITQIILLGLVWRRCGAGW